MNWPAPEQLENLLPHQREEYALATAGSLSILAGRPGTGKTFTVAATIKAMRGRRLAVASPTGKAAVRVTESLANAGVKGIRASTIHSLLRVKSADEGWQFEHDEENPLPLDFIFVDESSMIDVPLMASFLAARPAGCKVMLVGDPGQLSPVGHGAPLRDLIAAGLPCGHLTEIHRNSGRIVQACKEIAERHTFTPSTKYDPAKGENFPWIECASPSGQLEHLKGLLNRMAGQGFNAVWDCQTIVAVNEKSPLSRKAVNELLQGFLNPNGERMAGSIFRENDKVVNTKNGMQIAEGPQPADVQVLEGKVYSANGEQAKVLRVHSGYMVARLDNPTRTIRIPKGKSYETEDGGDGVEGGGMNWQLAYGITLHKAQGSDWPIVTTLIDSYPGAVRLCKREWIYTAASRGKTMTVGIGKLSLARDMCKRSGLQDRKTFLVESIVGLRTENLSRSWDLELSSVGV